MTKPTQNQLCAAGKSGSGGEGGKGGKPPIPSTPPNWRSSWRIDAHDYRPGKFSNSERFSVPGQGGRTRTAQEIQSGQQKVKTLLGSQMKSSYVVKRKQKFWSSPGPVYVHLKTKDELDPCINPQMFSKYKRFVPELKVVNQLKDRGFHKLALNRVNIRDQSHGYIQPIKKSKARILKAAARQPPHCYLGLGVHLADLERPSTVSDLSFKSTTGRFYNTMDIRGDTPGPGNYKRPKDTVAVHTPHRNSIPFMAPHQIRPKTVASTRRGAAGENGAAAALPHSLLSLSKIAKHKKVLLRRQRLQKSRYKGGGGGVLFSSYFEPSMMFKWDMNRTRHLGPGCYQGSAQAKLDMEARSSTSVKFSPLPRPQTTNPSSRRKSGSGSGSRANTATQMWPRPMFAASSDMNRDNFDDLFWLQEQKQNGKEEELDASGDEDSEYTSGDNSGGSEYYESDGSADVAS